MKQKRFFGILLSFALMLTMMPTLSQIAYADSGIVFTHSGGYELELTDVVQKNEQQTPIFKTPPAAVNGDYVTINGVQHGWTVNSDFGDTYPLELDYPMTEWIGNASDVVAGGTCYFRYRFLNDETQNTVYSNPVEVKIKSDQPTTTLSYAPKTTGRTMDRAVAKSTTNAMLSVQFEEIGDKVTVTNGGSSTEYTFDGMDYMDANNCYSLYDVVGSNDYGLEWADGETFEGATANYNFWVTINGTKVVSNNIEVALTGEASKEIKSISFVPSAEQYQMVVGQTTNPPDQTDGDKIVVAYDDYSTDVFTFDMNGSQGADFYSNSGKNLGAVLSDDWAAEWKPNQTFNVGDTPEFVYTAGNLTSNAVKVEIIAQPVPVTVSEIQFVHNGEYVMRESEAPAVPEPIKGDSIEVKYSDESTESFVYNDAQDVFVSTTTSTDIESKGTLSVAWNDHQEFKPNTTCYFTYALTTDGNTVKSQNIPVNFVAKPKTDPTPTPAPSDPTAVGTLHGVPSGIGTYVITSGNTASLVKAPNRKSYTVPATVGINGKTFAVTGIQTGAFNGTKCKTLTVKTKELTKASVRGSLKGSKVKTVKVKVGKKKENKKYAKKYRKIFKKKNSGKKVRVR